MLKTQFHTYAQARELAEWMGGDNKLLAAYASADIEVFPYQVAAAMFALRSPHLKGVILADEGSLGKTYEALLVASQKWLEGKTRQLVILPSNLVEPWADKLERGFTLPYVVWDSGEAPPDEDALVVTTYDYAARHAEAIAAQEWDMVIFDEADTLSKPENKTTATLNAATKTAFKLLLTPTPITKDIMDIHGLIHFIDPEALPDAETFYKRYFRRSENYPELTERVSGFVFRTLKSQVAEYVNFTRRVPFSPCIELTEAERELHEKVARFVAMPDKASFPRMEPWELSLMLFHSLSSSPWALRKTIEGAIARAEGAELALLEEIRKCAGAIEITAKMRALLDTLRATKPLKTIVFTDNLTTLHALKQFIEREGFNVLTTEQPDYESEFRRRRGHAVLLATDAAAKGLDFEFCPVVVNYDLLFNAIQMEQRVARCHRQGQTRDVLVVNLLCRENLADVRILELINKRVLQFDGIFGMSDPLVGNFDAPMEDVLAQLRDKATISQDFADNLAANKAANKQLVAHAEDVLFTTFTPEVADKITITPDYIEEKIEELNARLWAVARAYFSGREEYAIDDEARTATLMTEDGPHLFYYWTGSRNRPYAGRRRYGVGRGHRRGDRIVPVSPLMRGILHNVECAEAGSVTLCENTEPCEVGFYQVEVARDNEKIANFAVLCGITGAGRVMDESECRAILARPVGEWSEAGHRTPWWLKSGGGAPSRVDGAVPVEKLAERVRGEMLTEQTARIKLRTTREKSALERELEGLKREVAQARQALEQANDRMTQLKADKQLKLLQRDLRRAEESLALRKADIAAAAEQELEALKNAPLKTSTTRHFLITIT